MSEDLKKLLERSQEINRQAAEIQKQADRIKAENVMHGNKNFTAKAAEYHRKEKYNSANTKYKAANKTQRKAAIPGPDYSNARTRVIKSRSMFDTNKYKM